MSQPHLAALTGLDASVFSAWSAQRSISERNLSLIAEKLGVDRSTVLEGLDLRRQDIVIARLVHQKFEQIIAHVGSAA